MAIEQRVYAHYKALKHACDLEFVVDRVEDGLTPGGIVYGHYELRMPNHLWLLLARTHKMKVRQVKDIVNSERAKVLNG